jgi:hypothetical protein
MTIRILNILVIVIIFLYTGLRAEDDLHLNSRGPFQIRNQFPINLQFFSFTADNAFTLSNNDFRVSINYSHSNTFAQSPGVLNNFNESNKRLELTSELVEQLTGTDGNPNRFLIDSGIGRMNLNLKYGISDRFTLEFDIPFIAYHGGFLDKPIEMIHQVAGFPYASRAMLNTNTSQLFVFGEQTDLFYGADGFGEPGLGDIVLMAKSLLYKSHIHGFALSSKIALKLPTGNYRYLRGSGSFDYGIDLTATKKLTNSFISTNLSGVFPGKWRLMPNVQINPSYSWILSYEYLWGDRISLILQNQVHSSYLGEAVHPELSKTIFEWTAGMKYDIGTGFRLSFAITENYFHHNNTTDFGFHFGLSRGF